MGDRGNIVIVGDYGKPVVLYSHWGGSELPEVAAQAIANGEERWTDSGYFARIVFDTLIGERYHGETTGYGIYAGALGDNDRSNPVIVLDCRHAVAYVISEALAIAFLEEGDSPRLEHGGIPFAKATAAALRAAAPSKS